MNLLVGRHPVEGSDAVVVDITPESAGWRYVGFRVHVLKSGSHIDATSDDREMCLVVVAGTCNLTADGHGWTDVGGRATPFDGPPAAAYIAPGSRYTVEAVTDVELAIGSAPATRETGSRLLPPSRARIFNRGRGSTEREIRNILMEDEPAQSLLVTEVITPGGHWSSYPPHKHDTDDPPRETYLEETYYHRLLRPDGFAIQRVYTEDREVDATLTVRDRDVVLVPRGYHPVAAAAGYDLYYLNVMAGPVREWRVTNDPAHQWLLA